jgi:PQQ-dependent catabolism-associated CXXCW motif protein
MRRSTTISISRVLEAEVIRAHRAIACVLMFVAVPLAMAAGAAGPVTEPAGYWTGDVNAPTPTTLHGATVVNAKQVRHLLTAGAVVIDVSNAPHRPEHLAPGAPWMPTAHPGIPGALWVPGAGMGIVPVSVETYFRARLTASTGGDFSHPVVIYCHSRCWLSWNAAKRAVSYGYRNVSWFPQGIEGWRASGQPTMELKPLQPPAASPSKTPAAPRPPARSPDDDDSDSRVVLPA